jgi:hypothetical protein
MGLSSLGCGNLEPLGLSMSSILRVMVTLYDPISRVRNKAHQKQQK